MGIFSKRKKKQDETTSTLLQCLDQIKKVADEPKEKSTDEERDEILIWSLNNASDEASRRYYERELDKEYLATRAQLWEIEAKIKEKYAVISNVGTFVGVNGDSLIELCATAMEIEDAMREKRDYYESAKYEYSETYKTLAMIHEKRGDYQRAAATCVLAIQKGYTKDGTSGGMRGRLARMIKKGELSLTDDMKKILDIV